ncbi:MAG: hypothetical protein M0Z28_22275 [Rhodospirillales bacterium]|nr:hypothetical protein [Rhodospirillales bacterium]
MDALPLTARCLGYPVKLEFPDVDPDVLAQETALEERSRGRWPAHPHHRLGAEPPPWAPAAR